MMGQSKSRMSKQQMYIILEENHDFYANLMLAELHNHKNGKVTMHFDSDGVLRGINIEQWLYKSN